MILIEKSNEKHFELSITSIVSFVGFLLLIILYSRRRYQIKKSIYKKDTRIDGKIVIITGASSGIGKETALDLAKRGGIIYMASNDDENALKVQNEIKNASGNDNVYFLHLDLASLDSVKKFVTEFREREKRLDILINNAGILSEDRKFSVDGFEMHFAVNYLGHFLLTLLLLDTIIESSPSRIIFVSSEIHKFISFERKNLNSEQYFQTYLTYAHSKLAIFLIVREFEKRLEGTNVTVNSLHPGAVKTNINRYLSKILKFLFNIMPFNIFKTPWEGAQTHLRLALDPDLEKVTGKYFVASREVKTSKSAQNDDDALWLWHKSLQLINKDNKIID